MSLLIFVQNSDTVHPGEIGILAAIFFPSSQTRFKKKKVGSLIPRPDISRVDFLFQLAGTSSKNYRYTENNLPKIYKWRKKYNTGNQNEATHPDVNNQHGVHRIPSSFSFPLFLFLFLFPSLVFLPNSNISSLLLRLPPAKRRSKMAQMLDLWEEKFRPDKKKKKKVTTKTFHRSRAPKKPGAGGLLHWFLIPNAFISSASWPRFFFFLFSFSVLFLLPIHTRHFWNSLLPRSLQPFFAPLPFSLVPFLLIKEREKERSECKKKKKMAAIRWSSPAT